MSDIDGVILPRTFFSSPYRGKGVVCSSAVTRRAWVALHPCVDSSCMLVLFSVVAADDVVINVAMTLQGRGAAWCFRRGAWPGVERAPQQ